MSFTGLGHEATIPSPGAILFGRYKVISRFAEGAQGSVVCAEDTSTKATVVLKVLSTLSRDASSAYYNEVAAINAFPRHPNIVEHVNHFCTPPTAVIVMPRSQTDLFTLLLHTDVLALEEIAHLMKQLLSALAHCHEHGVAHMDVKPENILLDCIVTDDSFNILTSTAKLCDFGLCCMGPVRKTCNRPGIPARGSRGTQSYACPEALFADDNDVINGCAADIWSAGVMCYSLLMSFLPWEAADPATNTMYEVYTENNALFWKWTEHHAAGTLDRPIPHSFKHLFQMMVHPDPKQRFSAKMCLEHPFFTNTTF